MSKGMLIKSCHSKLPSICNSKSYAFWLHRQSFMWQFVSLKYISLSRGIVLDKYYHPRGCAASHSPTLLLLKNSLQFESFWSHFKALSVGHHVESSAKMGKSCYTEKQKVAILCEGCCSRQTWLFEIVINRINCDKITLIRRHLFWKRQRYAILSRKNQKFPLQV